MLSCSDWKLSKAERGKGERHWFIAALTKGIPTPNKKWFLINKPKWNRLYNPVFSSLCNISALSLGKWVSKICTPVSCMIHHLSPIIPVLTINANQRLLTPFQSVPSGVKNFVLVFNLLDLLFSCYGGKSAIFQHYWFNQRPWESDTMPLRPFSYLFKKRHIPKIIWEEEV